jgi:hypothetical protein
MRFKRPRTCATDASILCRIIVAAVYKKMKSIPPSSRFSSVSVRPSKMKTSRTHKMLSPPWLRKSWRARLRRNQKKFRPSQASMLRRRRFLSRPVAPKCRGAWMRSSARWSEKWPARASCDLALSPSMNAVFYGRRFVRTVPICWSIHILMYH